MGRAQTQRLDYYGELTFPAEVLVDDLHIEFPPPFTLVVE